MPNQSITTFPFFTISELLTYLTENNYYIPQIKLPPLKQTTNKSCVRMPLNKQFTYNDKVIEFIGYCSNTCQYVFSTLNADDSVEYYSTGLIWQSGYEENYTFEEILLDALEYLFTVKDGLVVHVNIEYLFSYNARNSLDYCSGYFNFPYLALVASESIKSMSNSRSIVFNPKHKIFRSSFGADLIWHSVAYPMHVFNAESINLTLFHRTEESIPQPIASEQSTFAVISTYSGDRRSLYLGGVTTYLNDFTQLDSLRYILIKYIYSYSDINGKYNYLTVSINHSKQKLLGRVILTKHYTEPAKNKNILGNIIFNLGKTYTSLKIPQSKKTLELEYSLEKWLDHHNLYTDELTISNYLIVIKDDFVFKVTNYLEQQSSEYSMFDAIP